MSLEGRDHRDRGCRRDGRGQARARTAPDRRRDRRGACPPRGRCGGPRRRLARRPGQVPSGAGRFEQIGIQLVGIAKASSGRSASVTSSSRSSIDASRFASTQWEVPPASTSPSTAPRPRSPICSRTWTSIIDRRLRPTGPRRAAHRGRPDRSGVQPCARSLRASHESLQLLAGPQQRRTSRPRWRTPGGRARRGVPLHRLADRPRVPRQPRDPEE